LIKSSVTRGVTALSLVFFLAIVLFIKVISA
jgi:hypothetical protein